MLPDTIFMEYMASCANSYLYSGYYYRSESKERVKALSYIIRSRQRKKDDAKSLIEFVSRPRAQLRKDVSPLFRDIMQAMTAPKPDRKLCLELLGGQEDILEAIRGRDDYFYSSPVHPSWPHYSLVLLYQEMYSDDQPLVQALDGQPEGTLGSFWGQCDEAIAHCGQLTADSSPTGQTIQSHLKAEDWGFPKDKVFVSMLTVLRQCNAGAENIAPILTRSPRMYVSNAEALFMCFVTTLKPSRSPYFSSLMAYMLPSVANLAKKLSPGLWYDADSLWKYSNLGIEKDNSFINDGWETIIKAKITAFEDSPGKEVDDSLIVVHIDELLVRPAFFGILYTLALFGIFDIVETDPQITMRIGVRKTVPYSPQDCLKAVRLTEYGLWSLAMSSRKPEVQKDFSDPVLDKDLLLVTYKGTGVKVRSLLSQIADPLGQARFKVTLQSFTRTCDDVDDAEKLIALFCETFGKPWPNWEAFFETVRSSFTVLPQVSRGRLLKVSDRSMLPLVLDTPELRKLVRLVEGGFMYVAEDDVKKLDAALAKRGYNDAIGASTKDPVKTAVAAAKATRSRGRRRYY